MAQSPYVHEATSSNFASVVLERSKRVPVLVDFWASWCAPCQMVAPILERLAEDYGGRLSVAKVNTDEQREVAMHYAIRSLPTLKLFLNGTVVEELIGAQPDAVLRRLVDRYVERASDKLVEKALQASRSFQHEKALALLRQATESDPHNGRAFIEMARLLLDLDRLDDAEKTLREMPAAAELEADSTKLKTRIGFTRVLREAAEEAELRAAIAAEPANSTARYQLGIRLAMQGRHEEALEALLALIRRDRAYGDDAGRKAMVEVLAMMDEGDELVSRYRKQMFAALH